jgi:hypothetical protein
VRRRATRASSSQARLATPPLLALLLLLLPAASDGLVMSGTLDLLDSWAYIARFCFLPVADDVSRTSGDPKR